MSNTELFLGGYRRVSEAQVGEILRLATKAAGRRAAGSGMAGKEARLEACAELLAEIGVIHNTPNGKRDWIEGRE